MVRRAENLEEVRFAYSRAPLHVKRVYSNQIIPQIDRTVKHFESFLEKQKLNGRSESVIIFNDLSMTERFCGPYNEAYGVHLRNKDGLFIEEKCLASLIETIVALESRNYRVRVLKVDGDSVDCHVSWGNPVERRSRDAAVKRLIAKKGENGLKELVF